MSLLTRQIRKRYVKRRTPIESERSHKYSSYINIPVYYKCYSTLWTFMDLITDEEGFKIRYDFTLKKILEAMIIERPDILRKLPTEDLMELRLLWPDLMDNFITTFMNPSIKFEPPKKFDLEPKKPNSEQPRDLNEKPFNNLFNK